METVEAISSIVCAAVSSIIIVGIVVMIAAMLAHGIF